ncbi:MAG: HAD family hydrolase [Eubacteriales bacterium]|nr:HAD family hydrolase [Eubacteriales bacterium]
MTAARIGRIMIDGILFDLDGTLWDSSAQVAQCWQQAIAEDPRIGISITRTDIVGIMGLQIDAIGEKLLPHLPHAQRLEILHTCMRREREYLRCVGARLYDGVEDILGRLAAQKKLFIVSNCEDGYIECFFAAHGLQQYFADTECAGRTGLSKGQNILLVARRAGLTAPVYVGDTQGDADAAREAGVPFIYARYGFGQVREYDHAIDNIAQLPALLAQMEAAGK